MELFGCSSRKDNTEIMETVLALICKENQLLESSSTAKNSRSLHEVILEKTIIKLGSLLALGFGEARPM